MNRFKQWMLKQIIADAVRQDGNQEQKLTELYAQIRTAAEKEYYEDNVYTIDSFLKEQFNRSLFVKIKE